MKDAGDLGKTEAELIAARRNNLAALRSRGADPFAASRYEVTSKAHEIAEQHGGLAKGEDAPEHVVGIAGRIVSLRKMGKAVFADLEDRTGRIQLYLRKDAVGDEMFDLFDQLDRGDLIGVHGYPFRSKMGELTIRVQRLSILGKSLWPFPDKWHGLVDVEKRYRQRYVDLIVNPEVRDVFVKRTRIVATLRHFLDARGFYEVETPVMLHVAGGAAARPFRTHHNALDLDLDLRIATELNLKRLIVGGLERVYEIGRIFRNEGMDTKHNPEFTMLELYAAYWSAAEMMDFNEEMLAHLVTTLSKSDVLEFDGKPISFKRPFARVSYFEAMQKWAGVTREELLQPEHARELLARLGLPQPATTSHGHALDKIFEAFIEPKLVDPTFVYDYPVVISPLAKRKEGDPEIADRYELFIAHMEVINAFSELNDPDDQRARFEAQVKERAAGDEEIPPPDWDFVTALEYGMPPTAGMGMGIDRLVMLLTNNTSIREVILFPLQRPLPP
ncbi:MAG TPA: lysine--tRNA ligase [Candidatus Binatia bacterium]|nr:lysine--tRNA ligase [Candidatus Binatia bacterium]